jgi:CubicO group peptidase (beta-lactamase class C family)
MKHIKKGTLVLVAFLIGILPVFSQDNDILLKGNTVKAEIRPGQKHLYKVKLNKDQFAFLQVMQKGADVQISTFDLKGNKIEEIDSPNGSGGAENILLRSSAKGEYPVEVLGLGTDGNRQSYEITLKVVRPKGVTPPQRIDELFAPWDSRQSPAASVAVVKGDKIIFEKGYGMANLENGIPNTPETMFHIASVTKTFTSYCVLLLEKQGKLSMDDGIRKYVPEVPDFGHKISLRQLAEHTSGIRDYPTLAAMVGYEISRKETFFKLISRQHDLNFVPGEEYDYSNTGFVLLAAVIERVSGKSYAEFVSQHILKPLKMTATIIQDDHGRIIHGIAESYEPGADGPKKLYVVNDLVGSMGIITNVRDLSLWAMHLLNPTGEAADIVRKMSIPGKLNNGKQTEYGLGLTIADYKGHLEIGHSGAAGGFKAHLGVFPKDNLAVIVLSNASDIYSRPVARQIAEIYFKRSANSPEPNLSVQPLLPSVQPSQTQSEFLAPFNKTPVNLAEYGGIFYSDELEARYECVVVDGKLTVKHSFISDIVLEPLDQDTFTMRDWNGKAVFTRDVNHRITGFKLSFNRMSNLYFRKAE